MHPTPPAGWYADPNGSTSLRWWNGQGWTDDLSPADTATTAAMAPPAAAPAAPAAPAYAPQPPTYGTPASRRQQPAIVNANRFSLITIGVCIVYIIIAKTSHVVFIGVFPALMAFRSFQAKEKLAPLAAIAAVVAIVYAVTALHN